MLKLSTLARAKKKPFTERQLTQLQKWLDEDWEAADCDTEILIVIHKLLLSVRNPRVQKALKPRGAPACSYCRQPSVGRFCYQSSGYENRKYTWMCSGCRDLHERTGMY